MQPPRVESNPAPDATAIERRLVAIEQTLSRTSIDARLAEIQAAVNKLSPPSLFTTALPALTGLLGVFIGGIINERLQKARLNQEATLAASKAQQDRELSEKQAKLQIGSAVIDWKLKQLSQLYGPLRALLGQSLGLYREMNEALVAARADKFRFIEGGTDPDKKQFQIQTPPGNWTRFRTVIHIFEVYRQGFGVEAYFDEIVSIGGQMVKIIKEHAGYARPQEKDLMGVFGKYLSHFAVLKAVHEAAKARAVTQGDGAEASATVTPPPQVNLSAAFPEVIHKLIDQGFEGLTTDIEQWHQKAVT